MQINLFNVTPPSLQNGVIDATVNFLADIGKKLINDEFAGKIRKLRSDAAFQKSFSEGLQRALQKFGKEYNDPFIVKAISENQVSLFKNRQIMDSLIEMIKRPDSSLENEQEKIYIAFESIHPDLQDRARVEPAVRFLLQLLAREVRNLPELQLIYALQFTQLNASNTAQMVELQKMQVMALAQIGAELQNVLPELSQKITAVLQNYQNNNLSSSVQVVSVPTLQKTLPLPPPAKYVDRGNELDLILPSGSTLTCVKVPEGTFKMGVDLPRWSFTEFQISLPSYWIGKFPVTNAQFNEFVNATKYQTWLEKDTSRKGSVIQNNAWTEIQGVSWEHPKGPDSTISGQFNHPVTQINWVDSMEFCRWVSKLTGLTTRLPSEAEWEKAARGKDGRIFSWGNEAPTKILCNFEMLYGGTTPIGQFGQYASSPYGCCDMNGNVWEWTSTKWGEIFEKSDFPYPYRFDGRDMEERYKGKFRILRGGGFFNISSAVTSYNRIHNYYKHCGFGDGFRICIPIKSN